MATDIPNFSSTKVITNLDTYTHTINVAAVHVAGIRLTERPPYGIQVLIQLNGSTVATSSVPAGPGGNIALSATMNCAVSDVVSFVITATGVDNQKPNEIKAILDIHIGSSN